MTLLYTDQSIMLICLNMDKHLRCASSSLVPPAIATPSRRWNSVAILPCRCGTKVRRVKAAPAIPPLFYQVIRRPRRPDVRNGAGCKGRGQITVALGNPGCPVEHPPSSRRRGRILVPLFTSSRRELRGRRWFFLRGFGCWLRNEASGSDYFPRLAFTVPDTTAAAPKPARISRPC